MKIRELDPNSEDEISLVAERMRQTLVEVLGEEKGTALYSMDWLLNRVRWHLDAKQTTAKIFLLENDVGKISGHAIARVERDADGTAYGYFSTLFVAPENRRQGLAVSLITHVEAWLKSLGLPKIVYNTASNHAVMINLFTGRGYRVSHEENEMVQLTKVF